LLTTVHLPQGLLLLLLHRNPRRSLDSRPLGTGLVSFGDRSSVDVGSSKSLLKLVGDDLELVGRVVDVAVDSIGRVVEPEGRRRNGISEGLMRRRRKKKSELTCEPIR